MVKIENVTKIYEQKENPKDKKGIATKALDNVSAIIEDGEFTAFAGPSGSGKTTMLNLIGCLDSITSGKIFIDDKDISTMTSQDKNLIRQQKIGFIFQSYNLIPVLTAQENVELALDLLKKYSKEEISSMAYEILKEVGLDGLQNRKPNQLSGGQQQRVSIARALVKKPSVILADEPTANLDSKNGLNIIELMQELNRTHNRNCNIVRSTTFGRPLFSAHQ